MRLDTRMHYRKVAPRLIMKADLDCSSLASPERFDGWQPDTVQ
jgi:hypothetical protein